MMKLVKAGAVMVINRHGSRIEVKTETIREDGFKETKTESTISFAFAYRFALSRGFKEAEK